MSEDSTPLEVAAKNSLDFILASGLAEGAAIYLNEAESGRLALLAAVGAAETRSTVSVPVKFRNEAVGELRLVGREIPTEAIDLLSEQFGNTLAASLSIRNSTIRRGLSNQLQQIRTPQTSDHLPLLEATLSGFVKNIASASLLGAAELAPSAETAEPLVSLLPATASGDLSETGRTASHPVVVDDHTVAELRLLQPSDVDVLTDNFDSRLLRHAAANLGAICSFGLASQTAATRDHQFSRMVEGFSRLNAEIYGILASSEVPHDEALDRIFDVALETVAASIPGSSILDVRWISSDSSGEYLYFRRTYGAAWSELKPAMRHRRFALRHPEPSQGARVVANGKTILMPDVAVDPFYDCTFEEAKSMIIAPILVENDRKGVLDVRSTIASLSELDQEVAEAVGRQLGVMAHLLESIQVARLTQQSMTVAQEQQKQATDDLRHQLKSPITQLERKSRRLLRRGSNDPTVYAIRGLAQRSHSVVRALRYYIELATTGHLSPERDPYSADDLSRMVRQQATDAQPVSRQPVKMYVDTDSFAASVNGLIYVDTDLLEQAVACLLDNAGKYSYPESDVDVGCFAERDGGFTIEFKNRGEPIEARDAERCKERGWRASQNDGNEVVGEGSGIGLWIVDKIMEAHGGRLVVKVNHDETRMRLRFGPSIYDH